MYCIQTVNSAREMKDVKTPSKTLHEKNNLPNSQEKFNEFRAKHAAQPVDSLPYVCFPADGNCQSGCKGGRFLGRLVPYRSGIVIEIEPCVKTHIQQRREEGESMNESTVVAIFTGANRANERDGTSLEVAMVVGNGNGQQHSTWASHSPSSDRIIHMSV